MISHDIPWPSPTESPTKNACEIPGHRSTPQAVMAGSWVILAVSGRSLEEAQQSGWFFQKIPSNEPILGLDIWEKHMGQWW